MPIVSDPISSATWRISRYADSLCRANDDGDREAVFHIAGNIRTAADGLRRELLPEVFDLHVDHDGRHDLQAALFSVRQERMHLLGSPWDRARLSAEESRLTAMLQGVAS